METTSPPPAPARNRSGLIIGIIIALLGCMCLLALLIAGAVTLLRSDSISLSKWQSYTNQKIGFSVSYPSNWVYEENENGVTLASSQAVLDEGPDSGGAGLAVMYFPSQYLPSTPVEFINYLAGSGEWGNTQITGPINELKVNDYPAASAELTSFDEMEGLTYHMQVTVILVPEAYYVLVGVSLQDEWSTHEATLRRIAKSLKIGQP